MQPFPKTHVVRSESALAKALAIGGRIEIASGFAVRQRHVVDVAVQIVGIGRPTLFVETVDGPPLTFMRGASSSTVDGITFDGGPGAIALADANSVTVRDCSFFEVGGASWNKTAVYAYGGTACVVSHCMFWNCGGDADVLAVFPPGWPLRHSIVVRDCLFGESRSRGVYIKNATAAEVSLCQSLRAAGNGIELQFCTASRVDSCGVEGAGGFGISIGDPCAFCSVIGCDVTVCDTASQAGAGIEICGASSIVYGCRVVACPRGIQVNFCTVSEFGRVGGRISNCTISGATSRGIAVYGPPLSAAPINAPLEIDLCEIQTTQRDAAGVEIFAQECLRDVSVSRCSIRGNFQDWTGAIISTRGEGCNFRDNVHAGDGTTVALARGRNSIVEGNLRIGGAHSPKVGFITATDHGGALYVRGNRAHGPSSHPAEVVKLYGCAATLIDNEEVVEPR